jgi:multiple sugar transport system permease protein
MTDLSAISANMGARTLRAGTNEHRRLIGTILSYALLAVFGLFFSFPLFWTASSSLQTWMELRSYTPHLLPAIPQWPNYIAVFTEIPFARFLLNTLMIIAIAVPGELVTASMVAYGFGRFPFTGNKFLFLIMLGTMMIPTQVTLIPQYVLFFKLKLINTYVPLTIGSWLGGGAFNIFLMRQFIMSIPRELDEAATIDGAGPLRILWQVLIPLMKPALTTLGILSFLGHWNEFFAPFIYLSKMELFTAAVGLRFFKVEAEMGQQPRDHLLAAAAATMTFPVLLIFILAQRYFVSGIVLSGLKM